MCEPSFAKGGFRERNVDVDGVEGPLGIAFFFCFLRRKIKIGIF